MGKYIVLGNKIFYQQAHEQGLVSLEDFACEGFLKEQEAYVLLMDVKFECLSYQEQKIDTSNHEVIQQQEILSNGFRQVVSITHQSLKDILQGFPTTACVKKCLPYVLGVRATLMKENIFDEQKLMVVFEHLKGVILLSVFEGSIVLNSRFFVGMNMEDVLNEVMRGLKRSGVLENKEIVFITNDEQMHQIMKEENFCDHKEVVLLKREHIGFLYIEEVRFRINFLLPQDALRLKEEQRRKTLHQQSLGWLFFLLISIGGVGSGLYMKQKLILEEEKHHKELTVVKKAVEKKKEMIFLKQLRERKRVSFSEIFQEILFDMPFEWKLQKVVFTTQGKGKTGMEVGMITNGYGEYNCQQRKEHCQIVLAMKQGQMMQTVTFGLLETKE